MNTLDGEAIRAVAELAAEAKELQVFQNGGVTFTDRELHRVPDDPRLPGALKFHSLAALAAYVAEEPSIEGAFLHVASPTEVAVVSPLLGADRHLRARYATATYESFEPPNWSYDRFYDLGELQVALLTAFEPEAGDLMELRTFLAQINAKSELKVADDGYSQQVSAFSGVAAPVQTRVKAIWDLAPYRTFPEVEQPLSAFALRLRQRGEAGIEAALFRTGGTSWRVKAVASIVGVLRSMVDGDRFPVLG